MSFAMLAENPRAPLNAFLHRKMAVAPVMDRVTHKPLCQEKTGQLLETHIGPRLTQDFLCPV